MCGSSTTGSLDHYLPRAKFPEFSILYSNLVPACAHCNSASKGIIYKGAQPERFIHPYFDTFADNPLWAVQVNPPYEAATFSPVPLQTLQPPILSIVKFHLRHVLGRQFKLSMANYWSTYPQVLSARVGKGFAFSEVVVGQYALSDLRTAEISEGPNGWRAALWRGILSDPAALKFIASKATILTA